MASVWPAATRPAAPPRTIHGQLGYYSFANDCAIGPATWRAALESASAALTAATLLAKDIRASGGDLAAPDDPAPSPPRPAAPGAAPGGAGAPAPAPHPGLSAELHLPGLAAQTAIFALCRPPGHHAMKSRFGGYCYLNNAAVAAQALLDAVPHCKRVFLLDCDYHAGNGTHDIFANRSDVVFASLHADPRDDYPFFYGFADEVGHGPGLGYTKNVPLPLGTTYEAYAVELDACVAWALEKQCGVLVVSLGVDTFKEDPIGQFSFEPRDYFSLGARLRRIGLPTVFVFEGGYLSADASALGSNVAAVLEGFESPVLVN